MGKTRQPYPAEFRRKIVDLFRAGGRIGELARQFEPSKHTICNWVARADVNEGRRQDALTSH